MSARVTPGDVNAAQQRKKSASPKAGARSSERSQQRLEQALDAKHPVVAVFFLLTEVFLFTFLHAGGRLIILVLHIVRIASLEEDGRILVHFVGGRNIIFRHRTPDAA